MVKVNCNRLRDFVKCIEPVGDEHVFLFDKDGVEVYSIDESNAALARVNMDFATEFTGEIGWSLDLLKNMIPKEVPEVEMVFGKSTIINATGYNAKVTSISKESCCKQPKKDLEPEKECYTVDPQKMYERLDALKKAFKNDYFWLLLDPKCQGVVRFQDGTSDAGDITNSVVTTTPIEQKVLCAYSYDLVMPQLNAVRYLTNNVMLRFAANKANPSVKLLFIEGMTPDPDKWRIEFIYAVSPRVIDPAVKDD
jgi:hypothetical protein